MATNARGKNTKTAKSSARRASTKPAARKVAKSSARGKTGKTGRGGKNAGGGMFAEAVAALNWPKEEIKLIRARAKGLWWATFLRGLAALIFGVLAVFTPWFATTAFVVLLGAFIIAVGVIAAVSAFVVKHETTRRYDWSEEFLIGLVEIIVGLFLIIFPGASILTVLIAAGVVLILRGIVSLGGILTNRTPLALKGLWSSGGVIAILLGILLLVFPWRSVEVLAILIGVVALVAGVILIGAAIDMHKVYSKILKKHKR
jgi:uncharacterized membrane protein HdeD (DUF308 family)